MVKQLDPTELQQFLIGLWIARMDSLSGATYEHTYLFTEDGRYVFSSNGKNAIHKQKEGIISGYQSSYRESGIYSIDPSGLLKLSPCGNPYLVNLETSLREIKIGGRWYSTMRTGHRFFNLNQLQLLQHNLRPKEAIPHWTKTDIHVPQRDRWVSARLWPIFPAWPSVGL